ncbi:probable sulfate transporter 3.5 [Salvia hispanica]|uniref:probable sulfate transporter 3.5 n=1 Tax=Salvia hispanica TaxID=49212 RepID=UPI0020090A3E|nr:probable sulfate transporter 3.5 [Salvia hispanica]XP_047952029.1 probable sulfate transporter 3.5 [Salvia hispanica]
MGADEEYPRSVNFGPARSFGIVLKSKMKETFFPDDPFRQFKSERSARRRALKGLQYFIPILEWLPNYNLSLFKYDLLAGITIASLAIPQGISYANLAQIPPIIGLYSSFVPPLLYAVFGNSKHLAVGTVAACSLLIAENIEKKADPSTDLYVSLVFTATLFAGLFQTILGLLRLGILVDFLSHSTITGFMGGTAVLIIFQQMKGLLGLKHFTTHTGVPHVIRAIIDNRTEFNWKCALIGITFLVFLQLTRYVKKLKSNLFWVSAIGPMVVVVSGGILAYSVGPKLGLSTVGPLKKGINAFSVNRLIFSSKYVFAPLKAGIITGMIALTEGIAIGRSFAMSTNDHIDGNKEMIAYGVMNIVGSMTSCYLTTGPFSKTAVNFNSGCKTPMANVVQSVCMLMVLLFLAPLFSYTPHVALSAIIISAMLGLIKYKKAYHLFQTDKFDFVICISAFFGVSFISMDMGLVISVGLALVRAMLYMARPATCKLGNIPNSNLYRDVEQYPGTISHSGVLILQLGSPIYFANSNYIKERILRWVRDENDSKSTTQDIEYVLLDLGGVTAIDHTGVEAVLEVRKTLENKGIKIILVNPRIDVMDKLILMGTVDKIGREAVYLSTEDALNACKFTQRRSHDLMDVAL